MAINSEFVISDFSEVNVRFSASGGTQHGDGLLWFVTSDELVGLKRLLEIPTFWINSSYKKYFVAIFALISVQLM